MLHDRRTIKLHQLFLALLVVFYMACGPLRAINPEDKVSSFALIDLNGKRTTLENLLRPGKPLLISFFATWCAPCNEEIPAIKKIAQEGQVDVVLISLDTQAPVASIKEWVFSHSEGYLGALLDPKGIAGERFGVIRKTGRAKIPHVFLVSPKGRLIWDHDGLDLDLPVHVAAEVQNWQAGQDRPPIESIAAEPPHSVWLLFTNSANGWVMPCDCPAQPLGGLARRASLMEREMSNPNRHYLVVDTGDNLSIKGDEVQAMAVANSMKIIPYDAMVPGEQEFILGSKFAWDNIFLPERPYLTANLAVCPDGKPCLIPYQGYKIVRKGGLKIGLIGIFHENAIVLAPDSLKKGLKVFPVQQKLSAALRVVRPLVDVVILLSHSGLAEDQALAQLYPGIDIIVSGHSQDLIKAPVHIGKTKIVQAGPGGHYLGKALLIKTETEVEIASYDLIPLGIDTPNHPKIAEFQSPLGR